jgi:uncharacterized protein (DUF3084 family)
MAGWVLVIAILILGGVIATVGDRIGTRVGKARLSLFNLRPRKTAVLISILTGSLISGTTLALLFGLSSQLRKGVFEYDATRKKLRDARSELTKTQTERKQLEQQRDAAQVQQLKARENLGVVVTQLKTAQAKQTTTQAELDRVADRANQLRAEAERLLVQQRTLVSQRDQVLAQINLRNQDITRKSAIIRSREAEIAQQDRDLARQSTDLSQRNQALQRQRSELSQRDRQLLAQRQIVQDGESKLKDLIAQKTTLDQSIATQQEQLQRVQQDLNFFQTGLDQVRKGKIVLRRGEVISTRVVRVAQSELVGVAIDQILREANDQVLNLLEEVARQELIIRNSSIDPQTPVRIDRSRQLIRPDPLAIDRLSQDLANGRDYVVRFVAAQNYLESDRGVPVLIESTPNVVIFPQGTTIATTALPANSNREQAQQGVTLLVESARYRTIRAGVLGDNFTIGDGRFKSFATFVDNIQGSNQALTLKAIARDLVPTAGPTRIDLIALVDGKKVFGTETVERDNSGPDESGPSSNDTPQK